MVSAQRTQLGEWLHELFLIEQQARFDFGDRLSEEQFNWRPAAGRWSVAECLDHLAIVTGLILEKAKPAIERARIHGVTGDEPFRYGMMGGWFVKAMERPGKRPLRSPKNFLPGSSLEKAQVVSRFTAVMKDLEETMKNSHGLALNRIRAKSAAAGGGWLKFNMAAWFAASLAHCRRHLAQAKRVVEAPGFPG